jgi:hypothetical protein
MIGVATLCPRLVSRLTGADGDANDGCGIQDRLHAEIQSRAHAIWLASGEPEPLKNWVAAERSLLCRMPPGPVVEEASDERAARVLELEGLLQSTKCALATLEVDRGDRLRYLERALAERDARLRQSERTTSRELSRRDARIRDLEAALGAAERGLAMREQLLHSVGERVDGLHNEVTREIQEVSRTLDQHQVGETWGAGQAYTPLVLGDSQSTNGSVLLGRTHGYMSPGAEGKALCLPRQPSCRDCRGIVGKRPRSSLGAVVVLLLLAFCLKRRGLPVLAMLVSWCSAFLGAVRQARPR